MTPYRSTPHRGPGGGVISNRVCIRTLALFPRNQSVVRVVETCRCDHQGRPITTIAEHVTGPDNRTIIRSVDSPSLSLRGGGRGWGSPEAAP